MTTLFNTKLQATATSYDLKKRLDWGEPALTIIDVRSRDDFNTSHICGAISLPISELVNRVQMNVELNRDIYVYGVNNEQTKEAAEQLRAAGYDNVAELQGGLSGWKANKYPVEGNSLVVA